MGASIWSSDGAAQTAGAIAGALAAQAAAELAQAAAEAAADDATDQVALATAQVALAEDQVNLAIAQVALATASADAAADSEDAAALSAALSAASETAALGASGMYADTAAGITGTSSGDYFSVISTSPVIEYSIYKNNAGVAVFQRNVASRSPFNGAFPTSKLTAAYLFNEQSGTIAYDHSGNGKNIDLVTGITNPNTTRTAAGIMTESGLIETPTLGSTRTVVILYRSHLSSAGVPGTGGFIISGDQAGSSGAGPLQEIDSLTTAKVRYAGGGATWHDGTFRSSDGTCNYENNRGGWLALNYTMNSAGAVKFGLGGRHSSTTSRCAKFEAAMAFFFNGTITTDEENAVLLFMRQEGKARGIYLLSDDTNEREDVYITGGESNSDGRAKLSELSAATLALVLRNTKIASANNATQLMHATPFDLGINQQITAPSTDLGPELGVAQQRRTVSASNSHPRPARIIKYGQGSTYMAPSSLGVGAAVSWNISELNGSGVYWKWQRHIQRGLQELFLEGKGINSLRVGFWIGLNDATSTAYVPDATTYQGYLQAMYDKLVSQLPGITVTFIVYRMHMSAPDSNATARADIRTAVAAFDTANANVSVYDTDATPRLADNIHYTAAGCVTMGINLHG